jgi:quercetin dioxygenase-like cupin family protein
MSSIPIKITLLITLAVTLVFASMALAQGHVMLTSAEIQWGEAPPMVPPGAKMAVLSGNPVGDSLYTVRFKVPANYRIPAHSHPKDEYVTVLSGSLSMGMGDKLDLKGGKALGVGGFAMMPANMNHFAYTKKETIIQLHGQGPVDFKYVNPADDPRNKK